MDESFEAQVQNLRQQAELLGAEKEQQRIIKMIELQSFVWVGNKKNLELGKDELLALIKGEK